MKRKGQNFAVTIHVVGTIIKIYQMFQISSQPRLVLK